MRSDAKIVRNTYIATAVRSWSRLISIRYLETSTSMEYFHPISSCLSFWDNIRFRMFSHARSTAGRTGNSRVDSSWEVIAYSDPPASLQCYWIPNTKTLTIRNAARGQTDSQKNLSGAQFTAGFRCVVLRYGCAQLMLFGSNWYT